MNRISSIARILSDAVMAIVSMLFWAVNEVILIFLKFLGMMVSSIKYIMLYIPRRISRFIPQKTTTNLNQQLIYAGVEMTSEEVISITMVYSLVLSATSYLMAQLTGAAPAIIYVVVAIVFGSVWALPFLLLNILANNRAASVEQTMPDLLTMVAQNMSSGMTSYNALWNSARPEFGPLAMEIQDVAKSTLTGIPLTDALMGMTNHIKFAKLARVIRLMIEGMKSGGELPTVLLSIAQDIRAEDNLKKQMASETSAQTIFIIFAIVIGAPLLFAVSTQFITIYSEMMNKLDIVELAKNTPQTTISIQPISITPADFQLYAIGILVISSLFGSLLLGILKDGNPMSGVAGIPVLSISSILIFITIKIVLGTIFAGMIAY